MIIETVLCDCTGKELRDYTPIEFPSLGRKFQVCEECRDKILNMFEYRNKVDTQQAESDVFSETIQ